MGNFSVNYGVFDAHVDTPLRIMDRGVDLGIRNTINRVDIPRMREGQVKTMGFALWVDPQKYPGDEGWKRILALHQSVDEQVQKYPEHLVWMDSEHVTTENKITLFCGIEGGHFIQEDCNYLESMKELDIKYLTLVWSKTHDWADSAEDEPRHHGLSSFGKEYIHLLNQTGILIDLSHASDQVIEQVLELSSKSVIISHACCRSLLDISRNISDPNLRKLAKNGGVIGISFYGNFFTTSRSPDRKVFLSQVIEHIDYAVQIMGIDHVGIGSDFDGANFFPDELDDCSSYPRLIEGLILRGYREPDLQKIMMGNFSRLIKGNS